MKTVRRLVLVVFLSFSIHTMAQVERIPDTRQGLEKVYVNYFFDRGLADPENYEADQNQIDNMRNTRSNVPGLYPYLIYDLIFDLRAKNFNPKMMNIFFAEEVATFLYGSKDLSLQQGYAVLTPSNDKTSVFLGYTFDIRKDRKSKRIEKLSNLITLGINSNLKGGFSETFKNDVKSSDISFTVKFTHVGKGAINFFKNQKKYLRNYRNGYLLPKYQSEFKKYMLSEFDKDFNRFNYFEGNTEKQTEFIKEKYVEYYSKLADSEVKIIKEEELYNFSTNHWVTVDLMLPFSVKEYSITSDFATIDLKPYRFYDWNATISYSKYWSWAKGTNFYISGLASVYANNTVKNKALPGYNSQVLESLSGNTYYFNDATKIYKGIYDEFVSKSLSAEGIFMPFQNYIGISGAFEFSFADKKEYESKNWKLGLPISLKDKEGKPTINFEVQWKEVYGDHFIGFSIGTSFGKYIK